MRIFVARLPRRVTSLELRAAFEPWGVVSDAYVLTDRQTGESRSCGFVTMPDEQQARRAMNEVDGMTWDGRQIVCEIAKEREQRV